ncbi:MAG TPA: hypothetical protein VHU92_17895 [Streptosporangiaceae bacterium]|jgi:hypothetical protein|nr:hypothetical protein [Streptosporangiaceae bacterium]
MGSEVIAGAWRAWSANGGHALALGGGGLGRGLVHFLIFRFFIRTALLIWRVPVAGPVIDIVLGVVIVTLLVLRAQLGPRWWQRRGGSGRWSGHGSGHGSGRGSGRHDW